MWGTLDTVECYDPGGRAVLASGTSKRVVSASDLRGSC